MATAEQMAAYTQRLREHKPAQDKPVTEIAIFKLRPAYAGDHAAARAVFASQVLAHTAPGRPHARGIRRVAWGFSAADPGVLVWLLDWDRIQDHWAVWQTPAFPPVLAAIAELFVPGPPLVRHYDFGAPGMLPAAGRWARVLVWDDADGEAKEPEEARARVLRSQTYRERRQAYAVDLDQETWYCLLLGYESEADARAEMVSPSFEGEDHVVELEYFEKPT
ncbi:hypothetical protein F4780DRAFT_776287 [Xylariomycetidae sp. FL0641]|nr:hypothetical protein F4780DRAFT_776287 [Xylariomycetidae sp. FL0641]